jgi:lipid II:glycine glycyltransferase (peptidoglycan interpeptide bridge formation enzyme)
MIIREVREIEKDAFNNVAAHPLQTWEWGDFRRKTGVGLVRLGVFNNDRLVKAYQLTAHFVPFLGFSILNLLRGPLPDEEMLRSFAKVATEKNSIYVKVEPNIAKIEGRDEAEFTKNQEFLIGCGLLPGKAQFARYTFWLDLTKSEDELLSAMHEKTRYNLRLAQKHGVTVTEDNSQEIWNAYWKLTEATTQRQAFYAHDRHYHELLWETLKPTGMLHLLKAEYQGQILSAWLLIHHKNTLYYPYGAWSGEHREVMANNLMMWEAIRFGQSRGAKLFDLWGAAGPQTPKDDPWWGFTKFKEGYGGRLMEFIGSYDLVVNQPVYSLYQLADSWRWKALRLRKKLPL